MSSVLQVNSFVGLRDPGHGFSRNTCVVRLRKDKEMLEQRLSVRRECQLKVSVS